MENTRQLSDKVLLMRAATDHNCASVLVHRYRNPLYHFVYRYVKHREVAEDIVQETFLRCLRHRHKYPAIEKVSTWLFTIAVNLAKTELRRRKRWQWTPILVGDDEGESGYEPSDSRPLPDQQTDTRMAYQTIVEAIERLPDEFRQSVLLRDLNGLTYHQIAGITDAPLGTVKSRVNRGRIRLQQELRSLHEEVVGEARTTDSGAGPFDPSISRSDTTVDAYHLAAGSGIPHVAQAVSSPRATESSTRAGDNRVVQGDLQKNQVNKHRMSRDIQETSPARSTLSADARAATLTTTTITHVRR